MDYKEWLKNAPWVMKAAKLGNRILEVGGGSGLACVAIKKEFPELKFTDFFVFNESIFALDDTLKKNDFTIHSSVYLKAKDNYIVFIMRAAANLDRKKMYLYDIKNDFLYISEAGNFNFGYPSIGTNNIFWTSDKDGRYKVYYADLNNLQNDNQFIEISKLFMADPIRTANLSGQILLQVEKNGEAWYVDANTQGGSFASEAWFQNENKQFICYLGRPKDAFDLMRQVGIGITNQDLEKIPINMDEQDGWGYNIDFGKEDNDNDGLYNSFEDAIGTDKNNTDSDGDGYGDKNEIVSGYNPMGPDQFYINQDYANNLKGKILLQVENNGEAWYVNPRDGERHFLGRPTDAFNLMKFLGLGISNNDFNNLFIK